MTKTTRPELTLVWAAALLAGLLHVPEPVHAENHHDPSPTKQIILFSQTMCCSNRSWLALEETLRDEINATGLTVVVNDDTGTAMSSQLLEAINRSARRGILGGIRVYRQPGSAELVLEHELQPAVPGGSRADSQGRIYLANHDNHPPLAALRSTEALVAILIQQKLVPADFGQSPAPAPAPPATKLYPSEPKPYDPSMVLGARIGAAFTNSTVGPRGTVALSLGWLPTRHLTLELEAITSFAGAALETDETSSRFQYAAVRLWTNWRFIDLQRFFLIGGLGAGVALPWVRGQQSDRFENSSGVTATFYPSARLLLGWKIARAFELALDSSAGLFLPRVRIEVADDTLTRVGPIIVESTLALRWLF